MFGTCFETDVNNTRVRFTGGNVLKMRHDMKYLDNLRDLYDEIILIVIKREVIQSQMLAIFICLFVICLISSLACFH